MDILPAPSGASKIEVTFHIDASGLVYLSAKDVVTGEVKESEYRSYLKEEPFCDVMLHLQSLKFIDLDILGINNSHSVIEKKLLW